MKSSTLRILFLLVILSVAGIIVVQVYWVQKAYSLEERNFNINVNNSLRNVATRVWELKKTQALNYNVVDQVEEDYFIVQVNHPVNVEILEHFIREEFEANNIITDFEFGLYDCEEDSVVSRHYVNMSGSKESFEPTKEFLKLSKDNYYFSVYFPNRKIYLVSQLSIWTAGTVILAIAIIFLGYVMFVLLKQKRLSEVQKDFVNNMTHEFKTPLASIQLSAEVLKNPDIVNRPQKLLNYATIIDNEASQLAMQVERVLQMAHAEKGEIQLHKKNIVWQDIIADAVQHFKSILQKHEVSVVLQMPKTPVTFYGDPLHLKNVLNNLLDNAIKYSHRLSEIIIKLEQLPKECRISVIDQGIGIDKKHQELLFEKFYRVPTGNVHNIKGFGLGLNYVKIIVKAHGGEVTCVSNVGKGSIFSLTFRNK